MMIKDSKNPWRQGQSMLDVFKKEKNVSYRHFNCDFKLPFSANIGANPTQELLYSIEIKPFGLEFYNSRCLFTKFASLIHFGQIWSKKSKDKMAIFILFRNVTTFYSNISWYVQPLRSFFCRKTDRLRQTETAQTAPLK